MKIARNIALASLLLLGGTATAAEWQVVQNAGMEVRLYKPDSQPKVNGKRALMVSMHGCASNMNGAEWMQEKANWQPTAEEYGMAVALPRVPYGAYGMNCWDWKPADHSRDNYHNSYVLELVDNLIADPQLNIDPKQVYVSGLSSGAGEALILGCLAPDVFAGMGLSAAPPVGNYGNIRNQDIVEIASKCKEYARDSISFFDTQVTSVIIGSEDNIVYPYTQNAIAHAMADVYQVERKNMSEIFPNEWSTSWGDDQHERVVFTEIPGMGHAWPAGGGPGDDWADTTKINYPAHLTELLFENNQRVDAETCKNITLDEINYNPETKVFTASGTATKDCQNAVVSITVADSADSQSPANDEYSFIIQNVTCPDEIKVTLENASHETFTVTDMYTGSCGQTETPPVIESFNAITAEGTVSLSGVASDEDGTVVSAVITIDDTDYDAEVDENGVFNLNIEGLAVGEYTAIAVVMDDDALTDDATTEFTISSDDLLPPAVRLKPVEVDGQTAVISGTASDADGEVIAVTVTVNDTEYLVALNDGEFTKTLNGLDAGSYSVVATAADNDEQKGIDTIGFIIAEIEKLAPTVSVKAGVNGTSVTISGTASDVDGDIVEVVVSVNGSDYVVANGSFSKTITDLTVGSYEVVVTATDSDDLIATASTSFKIEEQGESIWDTWLKWWASFWKF